MRPNPSETLCPDLLQELDPGELAQACGLTVTEIEELVGYGALLPQSGGRFDAACLAPLRRAARLRSDFDLDLFATGLLLESYQRIAWLEHRVRALEAHVPPHVQHGGREGPAPWREPHG